MRAAPLAENVRPVRPGLPGGQYKPLTEAGVRRIHEAALDALENIGLANAPKSGIEIMTGAGAILGEDGRLRFPRALVEDMLALAPRATSRSTAAIRNTISNCRAPASITARRARRCISSMWRSANTANRPRKTSSTPPSSSITSTTCISSSGRWSAAMSRTIS
jgi:hypothetical protein